jgi:uncharacterized protein (DUF1499 family)
LAGGVNGKPSTLARVALWCGGFAFVAAVVGPLFAHFGIVPPMVGFVILAIGLLDAATALLLGTIAMFRGGEASRGAAMGGILAAMLVVGPVLIAASSGAGLPRINDITTDTENPPQFTQAMRLEENAGRDLSYPGESFAAQQRAGYADLGPLRLDVDPGEAFARALAAANRIDTWEITLADPGIRKIEGVDTTWLFRFQDDFVIEVRPDGSGGSLLHMRSKSRDGKGDVGANAARIRAFFERVEQTPATGAVTDG